MAEAKHQYFGQMMRRTDHFGDLDAEEKLREEEGCSRRQRWLDSINGLNGHDFEQTRERWRTKDPMEGSPKGGVRPDLATEQQNVSK